MLQYIIIEKENIVLYIINPSTIPKVAFNMSICLLRPILSISIWQH